MNATAIAMSSYSVVHHTEYSVVHHRHDRELKFQNFIVKSEQSTAMDGNIHCGCRQPIPLSQRLAELQITNKRKKIQIDIICIHSNRVRCLES